MWLKASDQPNFMLVGCYTIQLLYTNETLNDVTGAARTFASAFHNKLACCIDKYHIMIEWAIVAILDTRQKLLGKFCHLFNVPCGTKWLISCGSYWDGHKDFVTNITDNVIKYARDMADDYFKDQWPPLQQEQEVMEKGNTCLKKGKGKGKVRVSRRGE